jgi:flagellar hook-basal body complex protein FliE
MMTKILPVYQPFNLPDTGKIKLPAEKIEGSESFGQIFKGMLNETNQLQNNAADIAQKFALGEIEDVHDVMIAAEKAGVSFELVMEIRNKLVDAYQEMMRMQV